mmetsp:Transcript_32244/g.63996  ORF Transcript_32244/g.63996 Transcript_32244/m.63996 type:complete len:88 (-) Transcript_32244:75-338(-)
MTGGDGRKVGREEAESLYHRRLRLWEEEKQQRGHGRKPRRMQIQKPHQVQGSPLSRVYTYFFPSYANQKSKTILQLKPAGSVLHGIG